MTGEFTRLADLVPHARLRINVPGGVRAWAANREAFTRPPILDVAEYWALPARDRRRYDLHRQVANANFDIVGTPMSDAVFDGMWDRLWANALNRSPGAVEGIMVNGGGAQGKSATVLTVVAEFLRDWDAEFGHRNPHPYPGGRDAHEAVVYAECPARPDMKKLLIAILEALGEEWEDRDKIGQLRSRAKKALIELGTRVLVIDDITRIKLHRLDDQEVLDLLRDLMDTGATLVLIGVGIPASGLLAEGRTDAGSRPAGTAHVLAAPANRLRKRTVEDDDQYTQTERRFKLLQLTNFGSDSDAHWQAWVEFLSGVGAGVRLLGMDKDHPGRLLTDGVMPEYLYRRTGGVVGTLIRLLEEATTRSMRHRDPLTGIEPFSPEFLDTVSVNFSGEDGRVAEAGEVPVVPPVPRPPRPAPKARRQNTVFHERAAGQSR